MAKKSYKIPTSLDVTYFDMEFSLRTKSGVGINTPVTAKVVVFSLIALFAWFYLVSQTFIGRGGIIHVIGFTIAWVTLSILLVKADKTKRTGFELAYSLVDYLPKSSRYLPVRLSDSVYPLKGLLNIDFIDPEDSMIHYYNGDIGHVYNIVGSASTLMFEEDKRILLDKVAAFYRKLSVGVEVVFDTVYEGHSVEEQMSAVEYDINNLKSKSVGLNELLNEKHNVLNFVVNDDLGITSLHQYLVVRAPNQSELRDFENLLLGDVEGDGLMFRYARTLSYVEVQKYFKSVLTGVNVSDED